MNAQSRLLLIVLMIAAGSALLAGCARARKGGEQPEAPSVPPPSALQAPSIPSSEPSSPGLAGARELLRYVPSRERVLEPGDADEIITSWLPHPPGPNSRPFTATLSIVVRVG